jgi:hypothetical protein
MFRASNLMVLALVLIAGYIAGARWPQYYAAVMSRISG